MLDSWMEPLGWMAALLAAWPPSPGVWRGGPGREQERADTEARLQASRTGPQGWNMCVRTWLAAMTMPWLLGSSLAGCAAVPTGVEYCDHARPVYFGTAAEVDATPPGVRRQILEHNETVARLCVLN